MFKTEHDITHKIEILESKTGFDLTEVVIELLEEIRALKFGVGEIRKNEKQVKETAKLKDKLSRIQFPDTTGQ